MFHKITFQTCVLQDLSILQILCITTFYAAYNSKNRPDNMQKYLSKAFNVKQLESEILNPNSEYIFIKKGKTIIGYFKINENEAQTEYQTNDTLELERIYIIPELQGNGYGKIVLDEAMRIAKSKGKSKLWLGVWKNNPNAIRFYERNGFSIVGEHDFIFVDEMQSDWLMEILL